MSTSTGMADHSSMGMGGSCKISMLWNWTTIDACTFFVPSAPLSFESPFSMRTAAVQL
ncbi:hypothetical protein BU26DRAFT_525872 [Trematosphaeria pertusa]|uniref:Uncharacterized protein n=1 Tax=Trematosphaeria pertusa TaxID=390896 RepID=A0A6A6HS84_9PLEO|nr:uncharacterized protein BU26DRAFT_525872 [Trematosphaeria pertusa]KAF2240648.1 hypothetical protein BU26DRAFT_525872 [Trematosphaeria pertusa]